MNRSMVRPGGGEERGGVLGAEPEHRLKDAGNRSANRALNMIVIVRLRYCDQSTAYMGHRRTPKASGGRRRQMGAGVRLLT